MFSFRSPHAPICLLFTPLTLNVPFSECSINLFALLLRRCSILGKSTIVFPFSDREQAQGVEDRGGSGAVGLRQEDAGDHRIRTRLGKGRGHGDPPLKTTTTT